MKYDITFRTMSLNKQLSTLSLIFCTINNHENGYQDQFKNILPELNTLLESKNYVQFVGTWDTVELKECSFKYILRESNMGNHSVDILKLVLTTIFNNHIIKLKLAKMLLEYISIYHNNLNERTKNFILGHICCLCDIELIELAKSSMNAKVNVQTIKAFVFEMNAQQFNLSKEEFVQNDLCHKTFLYLLNNDADPNMEPEEKLQCLCRITETVIRASVLSSNIVLNKRFIECLLSNGNPSEYFHIFQTIMMLPSLFDITNYETFIYIIDYVLSVKPKTISFKTINCQFRYNKMMTDGIVSMLLNYPESRKIITLLSNSEINVSSLVNAVVEYCVRNNTTDGLSDILKMLLNSGATIPNNIIYIETTIDVTKNLSENKAIKLLQFCDYDIWFV